MCDMKDCDHPASEMISITEHQAVRFIEGLPEKITELNVCPYHALTWKLGWLLADQGFPKNLSTVKAGLDAMNISINLQPYL